MSGLMETQDGVSHSHSTTLSGLVATAQRDQAEIVASRNFQPEWDQSIGDPISNIGHRFQQVKVSVRPVIVTELVGPALEQELHEILLGMDENYLPGFSKAEDLHKKLPVLNAWMAIHIVCTPLNFSIKKCV